MNGDKVTFMQCRRFRMRPIARRIEPTGRELGCIDDWWRITSLSKEAMRLVNARTNHAITLNLDNVTGLIPEGGSTGCLVLKSQVFLKGSGVYIAQGTMHPRAIPR
jgi:hypothetical protein